MVVLNKKGPLYATLAASLMLTPLGHVEAAINVKVDQVTIDSATEPKTTTTNELTDNATENTESVKEPEAADQTSGETVEEISVDSVEEQESQPQQEIPAEPLDTEGAEEVETEKEEIQAEEVEESKVRSLSLEETVIDGFKYQDRADGIVQFKENLAKAGFGGSLISTYFGSYTEQRVKDFQNYYGLNVNGIADKATMDKINEIVNSPLQAGRRSEATVQLKKDLDMLGFGGILLTDYYGNYTASRVSDFQSHYGLAVTGIAEEKTLAKIQELLSTPLANGMYREDAIPFKEKLGKLGFLNFSNPTNYFGSLTEKGVKEFQQYYGLAVNGTGDQATLTKLDTILATPFQVGRHHEDTIQLKENLGRLGVGGILPTTYYGSYTASRVADFQKHYGLRPTGVADEKTLARIQELLNGPLFNGIYRADAIDLKEKLTELGFSDFDHPTTYYGPLTEKNVKAFQAYYGLTANGIADNTTISKLDELLASPFRVGQRHEDTIQLKKDLASLGFGGILLTSYYGNYTASRVADFQKHYGLQATGIADQKTLDKIQELKSVPMSNGLYREDVVALKKDLNRLGFLDFSTPTIYFGPVTEKGVKAFQTYYGLSANGVAGETTLAKIKEALASPYQVGNRYEGIIQMKKGLNSIGFGGILVSDYFGNFTEQQVKNFQNHHGLPVSGIADEKTLAKIQQLVDEAPLMKGIYRADVITLKANLNKLGFSISATSDYFDSQTEQKIKELQTYYGLSTNGLCDDITMKKISEILASPFQEGKRHEDTAAIKEKLTLVGFGGMAISTMYGSYTADRVRDFQKEYDLVVNGIVDDVTMAKLEEFAHQREVIKYTPYQVTFENFIDAQMQGTPKADGTGLIAAGRNLVEYYANPSNFTKDESSYLQFLSLSQSANLNATEINQKLLANKGTLTGTGAAFIEAGRLYNINEIYLMAHALHETGNGSSVLAQGVPVDSTGKLMRDENGKLVPKSEAKHVVYNMYGYGAYDGNALAGGAQYAFNNGWFTPSAAVTGGAADVAKFYIHRGQDTLYKMRWNPSSPGSHQYATHVSWAINQTGYMNNMYNALNSYTHIFDIPQFLDQPASTGSTPPINLIELRDGVIGATTTNVNFRSKPYVSADTFIATLDNNTAMKVFGSNGSGWYKAEANGKEGWISSDFVELKNLLKTNVALNVRTAPGGEWVGTLSKGSQVIGVLDSNNNLVRDNEWYQIYYGGATHWVSGGTTTQYVTEIK